MSVSLGSLDSLVGVTFDGYHYASLSYQSSTLSSDGNSVASLTATTVTDPYSPENYYGDTITYKITAVNDSFNTLTVVQYLNGTYVQQITYYAGQFSSHE
jgi:hypothetical protein